ncbi:MAG: DegT/DnrJ/EryC1/StrS family aminotransferase, partial [Chloroflexi bacterium]|nr:DegT/DnrJ/EryC1/StrS family aminotransferase [Chloroflexota bacterium]
MFRHLAPVTTPLAPALLWRALQPAPDAVARFNQAFEQYLGGSHCFAVSSGRTAFALLLKNLQANTPDPQRREVLLPAYTCPALVKVVLDAGLQPCLIDISPATFAYDAAQLAQHLGRQTLAILVVHPFGIPQAIVPVQILAAKVGALVIEDAAQSMGAILDGKPVGVQGDYGLFSLGPGKPLSTGGGGILCARDATAASALAARWQQLPLPPSRASFLALARMAAFTAAFHPFGWWLATHAGAHRVGENEASWGYTQTRLTAAQASIGLAQLPHLDAYNRARRAKAEQLIAQLQELDFVQIPGLERCVHGVPIYLRLP